MDILSSFPEKYLKCESLQGKKLKLLISHVSIETMGADTKPVLYFEGKDKGLVLNKTKSSALASAYGRETDNWRGKEVVISPSTAMMEGKSVPSINLEPFIPITEDASDGPDF
jgi:arabinogalactan endo-1,4-beta-galactosidase